MTKDISENRLTHVNARGEARMVDVSPKQVTARRAEARGRITMRPETLRLIQEDRVTKGDVLGTARIAGIMAAKRTPEIIPLCHSIPLASVEIELTLEEAMNAVRITARVRTDGKTGVEMEALSAVAATALTIYDMCKAVDREMVIEEIMLTYKSGGKSGTFRRPTPDRTP